MKGISKKDIADRKPKFQVAIRLAGVEPVYKTFDNAADAQAFRARVEDELREKRRKGIAVMDKKTKKQPSYVDFYGQKLRDVLIAFGASGELKEHEAQAQKPLSKTERKRSKRTKLGERDIGRHRGIFNTVLRHVGQATIAEAKGSWMALYVQKMRRTISGRGAVYSYDAISNHIALMSAACLHSAMKLDIEDPKLYFTRKAFPRHWQGERVRRLEPGEHEQILAVLEKDASIQGQHSLLLYLLALETGARLQELVLAEWRELRQNGSVWTIPQGHTKTRTLRNVSLTPKAREIMKSLGELADSGDSLIFHSFGTVSSVSKRFAHRMKMAGVHDLHFHDLRHEAISRLVVHPNKPPLLAIMSMVGHKSFKMVSHYTHLREAEFLNLFG